MGGSTSTARVDMAAPDTTTMAERARTVPAPVEQTTAPGGPCWPCRGGDHQRCVGTGCWGCPRVNHVRPKTQRVSR